MSNLTGIKKGDTVALFMFTGCLSKAAAEVVDADKTTITLIGRKGEMIFDKTTGLQTNCDNAKYANRVSADGTVPVSAKKAAPEKAPKVKVVPPVAEKAPKAKKEKAPKTDDDEYEEV